MLDATAGLVSITASGIWLEPVVPVLAGRAFPFIRFSIRLGSVPITDHQ